MSGQLPAPQGNDLRAAYERMLVNLGDIYRETLEGAEPGERDRLIVRFHADSEPILRAMSALPRRTA